VDGIRIISVGYAVILAAAAALNYIPGLTDAEGRAFGIFALDIYDDLLHLASAVWAALAAWLSARAAIIFLKVFGTLYLLDGLLGLVTGSGYLDLGILIYGVQDLPIGFKILANLPHIALGGFAMFAGFFSRAGGHRELAHAYAALVEDRAGDRRAGRSGHGDADRMDRNRVRW